jgi:hypothetical protein
MMSIHNGGQRVLGQALLCRRDATPARPGYTRTGNVVDLDGDLYEQGRAAPSGVRELFPLFFDLVAHD